MPAGIRILSFLSFIALASYVFDILTAKPLTFDFFGTGIPKNVPLLWYTYSFAFAFFWLGIVWKKSRRGWQIYLAWSAVAMIVNILNQFLYVNPKYSEYPFVTWFFLGIYLIGGLIFYYIYKQKNYFNK